MTFLQPWWWLLALLALPLLLWHARNPRPVSVSSLRIWRAIAPEAAMAARSKRRFRWHFDSSLWVQLLALLALVVALTGPRPAGQAVHHHILLLDVSGSMAAPDGDSSRLARAIAWAESGLGATDPVARGGPHISLVTLGEEPSVLLARGDNSEAVQVIGSAQAEAGAGPVRTSRVREIVDGLIRDEERTRITVLSDGPGTSDARAALEPWLEGEEGEVEQVDIAVVASFGEPLSTHGFTTLRTTPMESEEGSWQVVGEVIAYPVPDESLTIQAAFEPEAVEGALPWKELTLRFQGERARFTFETEFPGPGVLTLNLPADALPLDNTARTVILHEPLPLRVLTMGAVPVPLVDALSALDAAEVVQEEALTAGANGGSFDLAVIGPGGSVLERPADTVLWLSGMQPGGRQGRALPRPVDLWAGSGSIAWTGITDVPSGALNATFALPGESGGVTLLQSAQGPLLQVLNTSEGTDVHAAWAIGESRWARELGFARFVTELAAAAQPRHGSWTGPRCLYGRPCRGVPAAAEALAPGAYQEEGRNWVVDVAAGPETDLHAEGEEFAKEARQTYPWARLDQGLALLAAFLLAMDAFRSWRVRRAVPRERGLLAHWASVGCRFAAVLALILIASGVAAPAVRFLERTALVADSLGQDGGERARAEQMPDPTLEQVRAVVSARGAGELAGKVLRDSPSDSEETATGYDLSAVMQMGIASLGPKGGRLLLAGLRGEDVASDLAVPPGVTVDFWPAPANATGARLSLLDVPAWIRAGDEVRVRVEVAGGAASLAAVEVSVDGERLERTTDAAHAFEWLSAEPGLYEVEARLPGEETLKQLIEVVPAGKVALVTAGEDEPEALTAMLGEHHFEVETLQPRNVPVRAEQFLEYDVVALLDVPAVDLHPLMQESLERWVREFGGGLLIAGARDAFGPGGYLRTPLEDLSPLSARVPGEQPQAAIAFVLDRSGSMQQTVEGISRLAFTKQATVEAVELLHPDSRVAIVLFDDVAHLLKPLGSPDDVAERLEPITAGGGTNLYPALEAAFQQLRATNAEAKHMIVMTDGLSQAAPFGPLIDTITAADITISTVGVGRGADVVLLEEIARWGKGAFHRSEDVRALPSILSQEAMLLSGNPVREGPIQPLFEPGRGAFLEDLPGTFPEVAGYVRTTLKPEAEVHARTGSGDPLLASWRHGVGRVVALAAPITGEWGEAWASDSRFGSEFLHRGLRWLAAPVQRPGVTLELDRRGDSLLATAVVLDEDGQPVDGARVIARAEGPEEYEIGPVLLENLGRGVYVGPLDAFAVGRYDVTVEVEAGGQGELDSALASYLVSRPSSMGSGIGRVALASEVVRESGGRFLFDPNDVRVQNEVALEAARRFDVWAWLAVVACAVALTLDGLGAHRVRRAVHVPQQQTEARAVGRAG